MSRYVDIDRLEPQQFENSEVELGVLAYDYEVVQSEPYIDIVRCSECKYWQPRAFVDIDGGVYVDICNRPYALDWNVKADDFCSYGERKNDE